MKIRKYLPQLVFLAIVLALFAGYRIWKNSSTDNIAPVISFDPGVLEISVRSTQQTAARYVHNLWRMLAE